MTLTAFWTAVTVIYEAGVIIAVVSILRRPREPRAMWAWILALIFLPVAGLPLFILLGEPRFTRTRRRRRRRRLKVVRLLRRKGRPRTAVQATHFVEHLDPSIANLMHLATRASRHSPTRGNEVKIVHDPAETFDHLESAIGSARNHVHLEYFIFQADATGRRVRDLLIDRARQGVECRVLMDYVGCWNLSRGFLKPMTDAGVEFAFFLPVIPWRGRWRVNFRNHRKLAVIDGRVAFCGGRNIGDEYAGHETKFGRWQDTHMRIIGPAVHRLQEVFIEDWHFATRRSLSGDEYFPPPEPSAADTVVQVIPSGPDIQMPLLHQLLFGAVGSARRCVSIVTPYFIPDAAMLLLLQSAAYRGVRVQLLIPAQSNHRVALWAGRSYYNTVCRAGVEVYEYPHGMIHSKVAVIDQTVAIVGSANMDERSFRLNFELSVILYDAGLADDLYADFDRLRQRATRIRRRPPDDFSTVETLKLGLARLASPLL